MGLPLVTPIFRLVLRVLTFVLYAVTIMSAYGGRIDPDLLTLPAVVGLLLPYLSIATAIASVAWICARRFVTGGFGVLTLVVCSQPVLTACPISFAKNPTPGADTFTVMTYNVLHGRDQEAHGEQAGNRAIEYVINSGADIVCLQELLWYHPDDVPNFTPSLRDSLFTAYPYHEYVPHLDTKVLSKYPFKIIPGEKLIRKEYDYGRYSFYEINVKGRKLTLVNMHLCSPRLSDEERNVVTEIKSVKGAKESMAEMRGSIGHKMRIAYQKRKHDTSILRDVLDRIEGPVIVCGDMNDVPESYAYRLLRGTDLKDAYTETGFGPMITYNQHLFWFHLDQILYRGPLKALSVKRGKLRASDHYPVTAEFEFTDRIAK